jgi:DNA-binding response OmpR family regulator
LNDALYAELAAVRSENDMLRLAVTLLTESINVAAISLSRHFGLSPKESVLLAILADGRPRSREHISNTMDLNAEGNPRTIDVHVCRLRRKIAPHKITTIWGRGFVLDGQSLTAIQSITREEIS